MNVAVLVIVLASLALAACGYWFFGRKGDEGFASEESSDDLESGPLREERRTEEMKDREFAEHMIRANVYSRIYEAFESATGRKPTLDEVDRVVRAYRSGKTTVDSFESYIRDNPGITADEDSSSDGKDRSGQSSSEESGDDRTGEETGHPGDDRYGGEDYKEKASEDRFDTKNGEDAKPGHDRFNTDSGEDAKPGNDRSDTESDEDGKSGQEQSGQEQSEGVGEASGVLIDNVRRLLKLAGVVVTEERVQRVMDNARSGLSSLKDLIREEAAQSGGA